MCLVGLDYVTLSLFGWHSLLRTDMTDYLCWWISFSILNFLLLLLSQAIEDSRARREKRTLLAERDSLISKMRTAVSNIAPYRIALVDSTPAAKKHQIDHVTPDLLDDCTRLEAVEKQLARCG